MITNKNAARAFKRIRLWSGFKLRIARGSGKIPPRFYHVSKEVVHEAV